MTDLSPETVGTTPSDDPRADDYELAQHEVDMTVRLHRGGTVVAKVTYQEMGEAKRPGDTPEMTFARALAFRRVGIPALTAARSHGGM